MFCLKCGKETEDTQVFCNHCLEIMEKIPIKPGTPVILPRKKKANINKKQSKRKAPSLEEQLLRLKIAFRTLLALFGCVVVALVIFIALYTQAIKQPNTPEEAPIGQNYDVDSPID